MNFLRNYRSLPGIIIALLLLFLVIPGKLSAQVAAFSAPDTVCAGQTVTLSNTSTGGTSFYWNFCSGSALSNPIGVNIGNPGSQLNIPSYPALVQDGNECYSFIPNQGSPHLTRYFHGTSFSNNPVSWTNLGNFGMINDSVLGLKICKDNGQWIGFILNNKRLIRLNFGNSPGNTPTATQLGPFSVLWSAHCIDIINESGTWVGLITCSWGNKIVRINFGNSLLNTPVLTDLGTPGSLNTPTAFRLIKENGSWYCLVSNYGNNTLARLSFGNSLMNTPVGTNLGNPCPGIIAGGLCLIRDCETTTGFELNYSSTSSDLIWRLTFPTGITGTVTGTSLGNIGGLSRPSQFSELFRVGDTLFVYNTNRNNFTLTRHRFMPCSNASVPSSTLYNPPAFSYNQPGTYNVQLTVNEGLPDQASICKSIVVKACNATAGFNAPDTVCVGQPVSLTNTSTGGTSYNWNFCSGNSLTNPVGTNIGNPGNQLNIPVYMTLVKDGATCYSFIANQGTSSIIRYNHGNSFNNNPVSWTNLGTFGYLSDTVMGVKVCYDNGQWIGFINNNNRIVRLNFGNSPGNAPVATLIGPNTLLDRANCLDIIKEGTTWIGFVSCSQNHKLIRLNFGNSLLNTPLFTDLGSPGTLNKPGSFRIINENGTWYLLIVNYANSTLSRISFGNSLLNSPSGVNLGVVCSLNQPGGITLLRDCEGTVGYQLHYSNTSPNLIWRLNFSGGISGTASSTPLGNIGAMSRPSQFSEMFRVGDTVYLYNTNQLNGTLTRLRFLPCSNASVPSSVLFNPPQYSYNQPGTYNVQLIVNEGLPTQTSVCKSIVVTACNTAASFTAPDTVCVGEPVALANTSIGSSTNYWNFCSGNAATTPTGQNIGTLGGALTWPVYSALVKDGDDCFQFVTNQGSPTHITRIYHGASFRNDPVSVVSFLQNGNLHQYVEAIQIRKDNGNWYALVCNNSTILRLNFGASLWNTNPMVTDLGPFPGITVAHGISIVKEGTTWLAYFDSHTTNKLFRLNFGTSLANVPVFTDLGNLAGFAHPTQVAAVKENGNCYLLINNYDNNTLSRISFGNSYLNTPTGQNLGTCGGLDKPHGICVLNDCETSVAYYTTYRLSPQGAIGRLNFTGGVGGTALAQSLGNLGNLDNPCSFSELFRQNDSLFTYVMNQHNNTITRFSFPPCTNASVPSSTLLNPPTYSYNQPGVYNVQLTVNEGLFTQSTACKNIVVTSCNTSASFTAPDTICVGAQVNLINTSAGGGNYYWNFCSGNASSNPSGTNIGNPGNNLNLPTYITLVKDGSDCFSFVANQGLPTHISRIYHGGNFRNPPVSTTALLQTGVLHNYVEAIQIRNDNGIWYGFVNNNTTILRLNFGASLWNNSPTVTDLGPFPVITVAHGLVILKEGNTWLGFFDSDTQNKLLRLNFGNSLANTPVLTDLGNLASFNHPCQIAAVKENGQCYLMVVNMDNNSLSRISFGSSYLNTPTGQNLGNCGGLQSPVGLTLLNDCETSTGFYTVYTPAPNGAIGRLTFSGGIAGSVAAQSLGNLGTLSYPHSFSELFRQNDSLFAYVTNRGNSTLTRYSFPPCTNASVPSSTLFTPPSFSYNAPGNYPVRLVVDEGQFSESSVCKTITVMPPPVANLGSDRLICPGTNTTLDAGAGYTSYLWSTGATSRMIVVANSGSYWVKVTKYGCFDYDTVQVSYHPVMPVNLGPNTAVCEGQSMTFNAGTCAGCSYVWSNLSTGQPVIGTSPAYTTGTAGVYAVKVTSPDGCITGDTVELSVNPVPIVSATPASQTICSGSNTNISISSTSGFSSYSWSAGLLSGNITGYTAGFGNTIQQQLINQGETPGVVTYTITAALGSCFSSPVICPVTVNPAPSILNSGAVQSLCSASNVVFTPLSNIEGTLFTWSASGNLTELSGFAPGSGPVIDQQLFNTGIAPGIVTYIVIPSALGCDGLPGIFSATVNPLPDLWFSPETSALCSGSPLSVSLNSQVANTLFTWNAIGSSSNVTNFSPGSGNLIQQTPLNSGPNPETVTYTVTPSSLGCYGATSDYLVTINPVPTVQISGNSSAICSGDEFQAGFSSMTAGITYSWSASATSPLVTGYSGGSGIALNQVLSSASMQNETVTYEIVPTANGCPGSETQISVQVKPRPDLVVDLVQEIACYGQSIVINLTSGYSGAGFSWTASASSSAVTGFSAGTGTQISQALFNSGITAENVTYQIISSLNGCSGTSVFANVMTIPVPDLLITPTQQTICNGQTTALVLTSFTENTNYSWTATGSTSISGYSAGSGTTIAQALNNSTNTSGTATYYVTPSIGSCIGNISTALVTVSPGPAVTFRICTDTITAISSRPFPLKGGLPPGGLYSGPGVESSTGIFNPSLAGIGIHPINYTYENFYGCEGSGQKTIRVLSDANFLCGSMLTDPRDGKQYPTWQLPDGKCWMAANLAYGETINSTTAQTDNCISEHYCLQDNSSWCNLHGGFYQWDELMDYTPEPGSKGLCPPGWHIPQTSEWLGMLAFNLGQSQAAGPLRDPWLINGFHGVPSGLDYLNVLWHFCGVPLKGTFYWSSSTDQPTTAFARGLNDHNQSISLYPARRANAFPVRCIQDD